MKKLWSGGPVYKDDPVFKITTDSVLLAAFASRDNIEHCMDLGCGGGLLSVILHARCPEAVYDSVDIRQDAVDVCVENYDANQLLGDVYCGDVRQYRAMYGPGSYDLVVCNPPYYYNSKPSPDEEKATARNGVLAPAQFTSAAAFLLRKGGDFCLVHKPEFITDIFAAMRLADIEPKIMRFVCHKPDSAPSLVLISGRKGGRPSLKVLPTLFLATPDGKPSEELKEIYHMKKPKAEEV